MVEAAPERKARGSDLRAFRAFLAGEIQPKDPLFSVQCRSVTRRVVLAFNARGTASAPNRPLAELGGMGKDGRPFINHEAVLKHAIITEDRLYELEAEAVQMLR